MNDTKVKEELLLEAIEIIKGLYAFNAVYLIFSKERDNELSSWLDKTFELYPEKQEF